MTRLTEAELARLLEAAHGTTWRAQAGCITYRADDRLDYAVLVRAGHGANADVELAAMAPALAREVLRLREIVREAAREGYALGTVHPPGTPVEGKMPERIAEKLLRRHDAPT